MIVGLVFGFGLLALIAIVIILNLRRRQHPDDDAAHELSYETERRGAYQEEGGERSDFDMEMEADSLFASGSYVSETECLFMGYEAEEAGFLYHWHSAID
jgi:hypothetical protein